MMVDGARTLRGLRTESVEVLHAHARMEMKMGEKKRVGVVDIEREE